MSDKKQVQVVTESELREQQIAMSTESLTSI